jgi:hypothetical protein
MSPSGDKQQQSQMPANDDGRTDDRGVAEVDPSGRDAPDVQGEGNYDAARRYDAAQQEFVESGQVPAAARDAAPRSEQEEAEMLEAERKGKQHARE